MNCSYKQSAGSEQQIRTQAKATPQELHAALKLIELLYVKGDIPQHVYRNICADYYGNDIDLSTSCYHLSQEAIYCPLLQSTT